MSFPCEIVNKLALPVLLSTSEISLYDKLRINLNLQNHANLTRTWTITSRGSGSRINWYFQYMTPRLQVELNFPKYSKPLIAYWYIQIISSIITTSLAIRDVSIVQPELRRSRSEVENIWDYTLRIYVSLS